MSVSWASDRYEPLNVNGLAEFWQHSATPSLEIPTDTRPRWGAIGVGFCAGFAVALLLAVALIPDPPERIFVPVQQRIDQPQTNDGLRA